MSTYYTKHLISGIPNSQIKDVKQKYIWQSKKKQLNCHYQCKGDQELFWKEALIHTLCYNAGLEIRFCSQLKTTNFSEFKTDNIWPGVPLRKRSLGKASGKWEIHRL